MRNKFFLTIQALVIVFLIFFFAMACKGQKKDASKYKWGIDPKSFPKVVKEKDFPKLEYGSADEIWGFAGKDLSGKDLTNLSLPFIAKLTFDQNTRWPKSNLLPAGFSPDNWLRTGTNPGLGLKHIHKQGVTGRGISVAVFDKPILHTHKEFKGKIHYYEVFADESRGLSPHFHGISCASILAGKTLGVAPEATVYYFATPNRGKNFHFYSLAVEKLVDINSELPEKKKIRLVSISDGLGRDNPYREEWKLAVEKLKQAKIELIYSSREKFNDFIWGGCPPYLDRNIPANYDVAIYFKQKKIALSPQRIIAPGDYRTTASNMGNSIYIYWGSGGWSWAIPYLAGLAALAWQLNPDLTLADIESFFRETAVNAKDDQLVIWPEGFIKKVKASVNR